MEIALEMKRQEIVKTVTSQINQKQILKGQKLTSNLKGQRIKMKQGKILILTKMAGQGMIMDKVTKEALMILNEILTSCIKYISYINYLLPSLKLILVFANLFNQMGFWGFGVLGFWGHTLN